MRRAGKILGHAFAWVLWRIQGAPSDPVVLLYHAIEESEWPWSVSPQVFEKQIAWLKAHHTVVTLDDVVAHAKGEKVLPKGAVAITFDDGYRDTVEKALPILKKHGVPATLFLTSDLSVSEPFGGAERISEEGVRELAKSDLMQIEAHGHEHLKLTAYEDEKSAVFDEWQKCTEVVERLTGSKPKYLAYAYGAKSQKLYDLANGFGFTAAFTAHEGTVKKGDDLRGLRRVLVDSTMSFTLFKLRTSPAIEAYRVVKRHL